MNTTNKTAPAATTNTGQPSELSEGCDAATRAKTEEERQRHQAFLAFVHAKEQAWAAMSPAERAAAEAMWEAAAKNINDARAGHRKVFVG